MKLNEGEKVTIDTKKSHLIASGIKNSDERFYEGEIMEVYEKNGEERYTVRVFKGHSSISQTLKRDCLISQNYCDNHDVCNVYHDKKEKWICPFCES